jgi:thioredoxin 1
MRSWRRWTCGIQAAAILAAGLAGCGGGGGGDKSSQCPVPTRGLPTLLDLGSAKVKPSREMAPVYEALKKDFAGTLQVVSIDVEEKPEFEKRFNLQRVPAQIFYDASGRERFRHDGPWTREEILGTWKDLGIVLAPAAPMK